MGSEHNQVIFRVPLDATKPEIKAAVEGLFKVKVDGGQHARARGQDQALPRPSGQRVGLQEGDRDPGRGPHHRRDDGDLRRWR